MTDQLIVRIQKEPKSEIHGLKPQSYHFLSRAVTSCNFLISKLDMMLASDLPSTSICWKTNGMMEKIVKY